MPRSLEVSMMRWELKRTCDEVGTDRTVLESTKIEVCRLASDINGVRERFKGSKANWDFAVIKDQCCDSNREVQHQEDKQYHVGGRGMLGQDYCQDSGILKVQR